MAKRTDNGNHQVLGRGSPDLSGGAVIRGDTVAQGFYFQIRWYSVLCCERCLGIRLHQHCHPLISDRPTVNVTVLVSSNATVNSTVVYTFTGGEPGGCQQVV